MHFRGVLHQRDYVIVRPRERWSYPERQVALCQVNGRVSTNLRRPVPTVSGAPIIAVTIAPEPQAGWPMAPQVGVARVPSSTDIHDGDLRSDITGASACHGDRDDGASNNRYRSSTCARAGRVRDHDNRIDIPGSCEHNREAGDRTRGQRAIGPVSDAEVIRTIRRQIVWVAWGKVGLAERQRAKHQQQGDYK